MFIALFALNSCKSSEKIQSTNGSPAVSRQDFIAWDSSQYGDAKAVLLNESLDFRKKGVPRPVWKKYVDDDSSVWGTTVENKMLFLSEMSPNDTFSRIEYPYPRDVRWDLMTKCDMWLYSLDEQGNIRERKLRKNEMIRERLNDSTGSVRLNIQEPLKGKILLRKYTMLYPYYTQDGDHNRKLILTKIKPFIIQRDIPLLSGTYHLLLPVLVSSEYDLKQFGEGELNIQHTLSEESYGAYTTTPHDLGGGKGVHRYTSVVGSKYMAENITITVSNVMPLAEGSQAKPLSIEITRSDEK